jgi:hypothetical protein
MNPSNENIVSYGYRNRASTAVEVVLIIGNVVTSLPNAFGISCIALVRRLSRPNRLRCFCRAIC